MAHWEGGRGLAMQNPNGTIIEQYLNMNWLDENLAYSCKMMLKLDTGWVLNFSDKRWVSN